MRVLVATDDRTFTPSLVSAFAARGWDVVTGVDNLFYRSGSYDLIHLHWPEELIRWELPSDDSLERLREVLSWWRGRARIIATVHNLLPHRAREHRLDRELYRIVYDAADLVGHFSRYSLERVRALFGNPQRAEQVVHCPFLFSHLLEHKRGRDTARASLGIRQEDLVLLAFGAFRHESELRLLRQGVSQARVGGKRVIFAGRLPGLGGLPRLVQRTRFALWRRFNAVMSLEGHIPDRQVPDLFEAADAVLITRFGAHLNSGVFPLAMTIGTPIVAPRYGPYLEYLTDTQNELYEPGNCDALAGGIDRIAERDRPTVAAVNERVASNWGWSQILNAYLHVKQKVAV